MLASALHKFGWVFGGSDTSHRQKFGRLSHGKRITIQATAAGRRRKEKGKTPVVFERPAGSQFVNSADKHSMQVRNEP